MLRRLVSLPRHVKLALLLGGDVVVLALACVLAVLIRYDDWAKGFETHGLLLLVGGPLLGVGLFWLAGIYRTVLRFAGPAMTGRLAIASALAALALAGVSFLVERQGGQSRGVFAIFGVLAFLGGSGVRQLARRLWRMGHRSTQGSVLIYGAGNAGASLAAALMADRTWRPVAFVDDNPRLHRMKVADLEVLPVRELERVVAERAIDAIFLALPSIDPATRRRILGRLRPLGLRVLTVPTLDELAAGQADFRDLRQLDLEDLLGRTTVAADEHLLHEAIGDRGVLVTGGGGSIGAELCRQILGVGPRRLVVLDQSEFNLYAIGAELEEAAAGTGVSVRCVLGDVTDEALLEELFAGEDLDVVYHAAAYKHVPIVEDSEPEGVRTNVLGTRATLDAALRHGVERFVLVSTDKAVRPSSVMGASKRVAELVVQGRAAALAAAGGRPDAPRLCMVRFGNVIGSSGSVVPRFQQQIEAGGPVTVTHPDVTRFFMTISEASELVLQASAMAEGGEVFLLDMGEPVRILDLARTLVELSGLTVRDDAHPDGEIEIAFTGLRPGEKLREELLIGADSVPSAHPQIRRAVESRLEGTVLERVLADVRDAVDRRDRARLRRLLEQVAGLGPDAETAPSGEDATEARPATPAERRPETTPTRPVPVARRGLPPVVRPGSAATPRQ